MAMIDHMHDEREEIELLLPWYERGTLNAEDMRRVERHLAADPELRARLELIREEIAETIIGNESLGMPGRAARDRLMERIAAEAGPVQRRAPAGIKSWLSSLMPDGHSRGFAIAVMAAALVIVVQAALLISLISSDGGDNGYRMASGEDAPASAGTFVLVRFNETARADDIAGLLGSIEATIVDGPKPGGAFKLRIANEALPEDERNAILARLRERSEIVAFVALTR
jgi:anti-sigma factor RsiW